MSEEKNENMQQEDGVKIDIESPEAEVIENAEELEETEIQPEEDTSAGFIEVRQGLHDISI